MQYTNKKINSLAKLEHPPIDCNKQTTDLIELKAFIGLQYTRGLSKRNLQRIKYLFQGPGSHSLFPATMTEARFEFLRKMIAFDDKDTRKKLFKSDRFAAVRNIFEIFNGNCSRALNPDFFLCLDETLYSYREKIGFQQYNPCKPTRHGILFNSINSAKYPYTHRVVVCAGKPEGTPGEFYAPGVLPTVKSLVCGLSSVFPLEGTNLTMDMRYTSLELTEWLLARNMTVVGTIMANKEEIPVSLKNANSRAHQSYETYWIEDDPRVTLHSYAVKTKTKRMKNILIMSSAPVIQAVTKDDGKKKPAVLKIYDFTKGGKENVNQRIACFSTNTKSRRWALTSFSFVLDTARVNAQTVFALNMKRNPKKVNSYGFGYDLVMDLVRPQLYRRCATQSLQKVVRDKINMCLDAKPFIAKTNVTAVTTTSTFGARPSTTVSGACDHRVGLPTACVDDMNAPRGKKRCRICIDDIRGEADFSAKRNHLSRLTTTCSICQNFVCKKHFEIICANCKKVEDFNLNKEI